MSKGRVWNRGKHDGTGLSRKKAWIKKLQHLLKQKRLKLQVNRQMPELIQLSR